MRLRTAVLALLVAGLAVSVATAARPYWYDWPAECTGDSPVCFQEMEDVTIWTIRADDEVAGGVSVFPVNNFMRQNTDGSWFLHVLDNAADLAYIPPGAQHWTEYYWSAPPLTGHVRMIGGVESAGGSLTSTCPFEGGIHGVVLDEATGIRYKLTAKIVTTTEADGCRTIMNDIKLKPIPD